MNLIYHGVWGGGVSSFRPNFTKCADAFADLKPCVPSVSSFSRRVSSSSWCSVMVTFFRSSAARFSFSSFDIPPNAFPIVHVLESQRCCCCLALPTAVLS
mmetsp:Transcript_24413/g.96869  ORF Transcript_24413/g.96869 Transcript_24413/m.96869 type:complete len:100 (-) Transcript_24413:18-317(-)